MKPFEQQLQVAKKKQHLLYIGLFALFVLGGLMILTVILLSRGTRIEIKPDEAAMLSTVHVHSGIATIIGDTLYALSNNPV
ncbi:MAG TPA: hypothetical protein EYG49_00920, partial [Gammaproteobacteria bacterium]|nr:hypothetical protein [Gammaproteobacteria bacterium]